MGKLQRSKGLYVKRLYRMVKQITHTLYTTTDEYKQALLTMQLGECQLKLGEMDEARVSLHIALEHFRHHLYRTEMKKAQSLLHALEILSQ
jgi:predicted negative regulator of RcsB-dependent stress response